MPTVQMIADALERRVPASLKLDFDNVGLLCGYPEREVRRVLTALDVTTWTIDEARERGCELIVSHHPLIFSPLRRILTTDTDGKRVIALLENRLSCICLHTNLDIVQGGVNDALAAAIGASCVDVLPCGRTAELPAPESAEAFAQRVQSALGVRGLRFFDAGRPVRRIALCSGAGGELVSDCAELGCDTLLTGEIKYHQWLEGRERGINMVEADHFCTENVVVPVLRAMLREEFPDLEVLISGTHSQTSRGMES